MGYTLDYFVASLCCPVCKKVSKADHSTNMQTKIRIRPQLAYLGVGHRLDIHLDAMKDSGYLMIQLPQPGEEIRILQTWECPACGQPYNWAEIVVRDEHIAGIESVDLNRVVFERAHFISDEVVDLVSELTGRPYADLMNADLVQILRERL